MNKIGTILEQIFLVGLILGLASNLVSFDIPFLLNICLGGLALSYLMQLNKALDIDYEEDELMGFNELLGLTIVPNVLRIGFFFSILGLLFYNMNINNDGYIKILYIGGLTVLTASGIMLILKLFGTRHINKALPILTRSVPILLAVYYVAFMA